MNYLDEITSADAAIRAFYLRQQRASRINATLVVFTPEGISIMGDLVPGNNGVVSAFGYGIDWFASELSPDYLACKFLRQEFSCRAAADYLEDQLSNYEGHALYDDVPDAIEALRGDGMTQDQTYELLRELGDEDAIIDGVCWDYDDHDRDLLVRIQQAFARLYKTHGRD